MINVIKKLNNHRQVVKIKQVLFVLPLLYFAVAGCQSKRVIYTPKGYNITKPEATELGNKLREISGIYWINETTMLAQNDVTLPEDAQAQFEKMIDALEDLEDVQQVYHNVDLG